MTEPKLTEQATPVTEIETAILLEGLLFVANDPVSPQHLATVLGLQLKEVETQLVEMEKSYQTRGIRLQKHNGRYQLTSAPEVTEYIESFLGLDATSRLSRAALEALAIIAYKQPVTRPGVDSIRGVNSDGVMKSLLSKGLLQEVGRSEGPGRPILYGTSPEFLQHFGLNSLAELPPLDLAPDEDHDVSLLKG